MERRYFYCYSEKLRKALENNGFEPICQGINWNTNTKFWLFEGTDELNHFKNNVYPKQKHIIKERF